MPSVAVTGSFDDLRSRQVRFLEQAAQRGDLHVLLWSDAVVQTRTGQAPKFPLDERRYFLEALRYVAKVSVVINFAQEEILPHLAGGQTAMWLVDQAGATMALKQYCAASGLTYQVITDQETASFPQPKPLISPPPGGTGGATKRKKVIITGCYDWFHTGHVRFFEEVSEYGDVYAVVGHDANIALLKGAGHPQFSQDERVYMVGSIRYVTQALI
ncbi:MAG: adenylyltransferase/cytidyltransferase family protein, partial [Phycisphaerae bacterium]